jgi:type II secretion system protein H
LNSSNRHKGFTLFEILVVMVILAMTAGIVVPLVSGFGGRGNVHEAANQVLSAISVARSRAILSGKIVGVRFLRQEVQIDADVDIDVDTKLPGKVVINSVELGGSQSKELLFSPQGICEEAMILLSSGENMVTLRIYSVSGGHVYDGKYTFQDMKNGS